MNTIVCYWIEDIVWWRNDHIVITDMKIGSRERAATRSAHVMSTLAH
jgi:hypothetical protein